MAGSKQVYRFVMVAIKKQLWQALVTILVTFLAFWWLHYAHSAQWFLPPASWPALLVSLLYGALLAYLLEKLNRRLNKSLRWQTAFTARFFVGFAFGLVLSIGLAWLCWFVLHHFWPLLFGNLQADLRWKTIIILAVVLFFHQIAYILHYAYRQYAIEQLQGLQRKTQTKSLRYDLLKAQLSPHYLFNNLNTIGALLATNANQAEAFIRQLVKTYQYILQQRHQDSVKLRDELAFVEAYCYLLQIRFGDGIYLRNRIPETLLDAELPPLSLQLLIENAVKHNTPSLGETLEIALDPGKGYSLVIQNNRLSGDLAESFHIGLSHLQEQYRLLGGQKIAIQAGDPFVVRIPLFRPQT